MAWQAPRALITMARLGSVRVSGGIPSPAPSDLAHQASRAIARQDRRCHQPSERHRLPS